MKLIYGTIVSRRKVIAEKEDKVYYFTYFYFFLEA